MYIYLFIFSFNIDSQVAYDAVARLAQYIYRLKNISPTELLQHLPLPLCLSIFLFNSQPLSETINEAIENAEVPEQTLKDKFLSYPLLYNYLFKSTPERSQTDVSVYELLKVRNEFQFNYYKFKRNYKYLDIYTYIQGMFLK